MINTIFTFYLNIINLNFRVSPLSYFSKTLTPLCSVLSPSLPLRGSESSFWRSKHSTSICRLFSMYRVLILLTALLVNAGIHAIKIQIEKPEWPLNYKVVFSSFSKTQLLMNHSLTNDEAVKSYITISYRHVYVTRPTENS